MDIDDSNMNSDNILKILVATDNHLGYMEKDPIRGKDTFETFEEILKLAVKNDVDFILLGGDLFHQATPSLYSMDTCVGLLKKYCLGDKPVQVEFLSEPGNIGSNLKNPDVNYYDPNTNVSIPVFSIHGNHDDPAGSKQISPLDFLSSTGLVNYFGRCNNLSKVEIEPLLFRKGETYLALYGLSHIHDQRLARLFNDQKVVIHPPQNIDINWFNLFVLHQNRAVNRGTKNFIPESVLPEFIDLVVWGHEHNCLIEPTATATKIYISQPGSSVATSLTLGESIPKKVALLEIRYQEFKLTPIDLYSVRPFVFDEILLESQPTYLTDEEITNTSLRIINDKLEEMIVQSYQLNRNLHLLPLIRLNILYYDERDAFNTIIFGQQYMDRVANPKDMVKFQMVKKSITETKNGQIEENLEVDPVLKPEDHLMQTLNEEDLTILSKSLACESIQKFVTCMNDDAIEDMIEQQLDTVLKKLNELQPNEDEIDDCLEQIKETILNENLPENPSDADVDLEN